MFSVLSDSPCWAWIWLSVDCLEKRILFRIVRKLFKTKKSCPLSTRREKMFLKFIQSKYWYNCFKTLNRIRDHNDFDNDNKYNVSFVWKQMYTSIQFYSSCFYMFYANLNSQNWVRHPAFIYSSVRNSY